MSVLKAYNRTPIEIIRGDGFYLYDKKGNVYLDFASGFAVCNLGHNNSYLNNELTRQLNKLWHCSNLFTIPEQERLAKRLCELTFADYAFFCSSGAEAVEASIKFARKYHYANGNPNRYEIISLERNYHGRSLTCLSAGGSESAREGYGPLNPGFLQIAVEDIKALETAISTKTAAILIEPVQSEGGVYPICTEYLKQVRKICDEHDILLIFDEVQTGYGRSGALFHYQTIGVEPDILACAKAMGNGFPLAGCLTRERVGEAIQPGSHGSTFGGNPLAMAVGNAVLDKIGQKTYDNVNAMSSYFSDQLQALKKAYPFVIEDIRISGLFIGIQVNKSAKKLVEISLGNGLALTKAGENNVLRILPPLNITKKEIDEAIKSLDRTFNIILS